MNTTQIRAGVVGAAMIAAAVLVEGAAQAAPIVACIGEQSTHSLHKSFPNEYPAKLQKILGAGYTVCNWGRFRSGVTTTVMGGTAAPYVKTQEYQCSLGKCPAGFEYKGQCNTPTAPAGLPSYVLLGPWGKADTMESRVPLSQEQVEKDLRALAESYLALPNRPKVFIVYPFPVPYPQNGTPSGPVTQVMLPAFKNVAAAMKLPVIDLYSYFSTHLKEMEATHDGHLTEAVGHFKHAEMVAAAIRATPATTGSPVDAGTSADGSIATDVAPVDTLTPAPTGGRDAEVIVAPDAAVVVTAPTSPAPGKTPPAPKEEPTTPPQRSSAGCSLAPSSSPAPLWLAGLFLVGLLRRRR